VDISTRAIYLADKPSIQRFIEIPKMAEKTMEMLRDVLAAFVNNNAGLAIEVRKKDNEVDSLHSQILGEIETHMLADPSIIDQAPQLILVVRDIERIADHAKNIAEDVFYITGGKVLRHRFMEEGKSLMR
jgi:phosphate transport system protein